VTLPKPDPGASPQRRRRIGARWRRCRCFPSRAARLRFETTRSRHPIAAIRRARAGAQAIRRSGGFTEAVSRSVSAQGGETIQRNQEARELAPKLLSIWATLPARSG